MDQVQRYSEWSEGEHYIVVSCPLYLRTGPGPFQSLYIRLNQVHCTPCRCGPMYLITWSNPLIVALDLVHCSHCTSPPLTVPLDLVHCCDFTSGPGLRYFQTWSSTSGPCPLYSLYLWTWSGGTVDLVEELQWTRYCISASGPCLPYKDEGSVQSNHPELM